MPLQAREKTLSFDDHKELYATTFGDMPIKLLELSK
jgi:hypothetical protein